jgi:hypothetical protein
MKKYIFQVCVMLCGALGFTACTEDEGTVPGNDAQPSIVIYQYSAERPNNPDNDVQLRFATNNRTEEAYYFVEKADAKATRVASLGEDGYADYVVTNGTKLSVDGESNVDVLITDLYGTYAITAVAVNGTQKKSAEATFTGLDWEEGVPGVYYFFSKAQNALGISSAETTLQKCTTDNTLYRFKDLYGSGYSLKINLLPDYTATDDDGTYTFFRIPATVTPYEYGSYGAISVRDVGYWQGSAAWVTDNGYESGMYADGTCFLCIQYYVSAGSLGYGYDYFIAD